jgi:hypothetical protein
MENTHPGTFIAGIIIHHFSYPGKRTDGKGPVYLPDHTYSNCHLPGNRILQVSAKGTH